MDPLQTMTRLEKMLAAEAIRAAASLLRDGTLGAETKLRSHWWTIEMAVGAVPYALPGKREAERFLYYEGGQRFSGLDERINDEFPWPRFGLISSPECKAVQVQKQAMRYGLLINYAEMLEADSAAD